MIEASILQSAIVAAGGIMGGRLWAWLRAREARQSRLEMAIANHEFATDNAAILALTARVNEQEGRIASLAESLKRSERREHEYRRISHDMSGIASAAQLLLVTKFTEINEVLIAHNQPPRYESPQREAMQAVKEIAQSIIEQRHMIYKAAEMAEDEAELTRTVVEAEKAKVEQSVKSQ